MAGKLHAIYAISNALFNGILHLWNSVFAVTDSSFLHFVQRFENCPLPVQLFLCPHFLQTKPSSHFKVASSSMHKSSSENIVRNELTFCCAKFRDAILGLTELAIYRFQNQFLYHLVCKNKKIVIVKRYIKKIKYLCRANNKNFYKLWYIWKE